MVAGGIGVATAAASAAAATATAATLTVTSPVMAAIASWCPAWLAGTVSALGASTVAVPAAPSALLIVAGPVGWTIAGIGAVAIPLTWGLAKRRKREDIASAVERQVEVVCSKVKQERLPTIRRLGGKIVENFKLDLERRVRAIDEALATVSARAGEIKQDPAEQLRRECLEKLLAQPRCLMLEQIERALR